MGLASDDLELVFSGSDQTVGMRFTNLSVPKDATITRAYLQFTAKETQSEATNLVLRGQAADNPATFTSATSNVSSRPRTAAQVSWAPAAWSTLGESGASQRTPELKGIVQELVNRAGWASGNAVVFIVTGTGHRTAFSVDGSASQAPLLHIEYSGASPALSGAGVSDDQ